MTDSATRIQNLIDSSRNVLLDCCLENGSIVAANTDKANYPKDANNYRYVWPRDAAFILVALDILGEDQHEEPFLRWLDERAEDFNQNGLQHRRYATNGAGSYPKDEFQPDQSGTLLWSLCQSASSKAISDLKNHVIHTVADKLADSWQDGRFKQSTFDLWEHHFSEVGKEPFTYTIANCITGLKGAAAIARDPNKAWISVSDDMTKAMLANGQENVQAMLIHDNSYIDASLFGLIWPFSADLPISVQDTLIEDILHNLGKETGFIRFPGDTYDGRIANSVDLNQGAGTWPILSFWYILALETIGEHAKAIKKFEHFVSILPSDKYIPEQILPDGKVGVTPLGWSHAMFVITAQRLGYLS